MNNTTVPSSNNLPSMGKLIKSTILAICMAAIILVAVVLPAEYGIDPLGVGEMVGLAKMGQIKVSLAQEAAYEVKALAEGNKIDLEEQSAKVDTAKTVSDSVADSREDELTITLEPNEGKEIKLTMAKGSTVNFLWHTDGGKANFDAHADSKKLEIKYHNYTKGSDERSEGVLEAAFDGKHGWFWRNRTSEPMTVKLQVSGEYSNIEHVK